MDDSRDLSDRLFEVEPLESEQPVEEQEPVEEQPVAEEPVEPPAELRADALAAVASALDEAPAADLEPAADVDPSAEADPLSGLAPLAEETRPPRVVVPYLAYALVWGVLAGVTYGTLRQAADPLEVAHYSLLVWGGVGLAAASPLVALCGWLVGRSRTEDRQGLLSGALLVTALVTLLGVAVWWGALVAVDAARGAL